MPPYGPVISRSDYETHLFDGKAYMYHGSSFSLATGASVSLVLATTDKATEELAVFFGGGGNGEIELFTYEDAVIDTEAGFGIASLPFNQNRNSVNTMSASLWHDYNADKVSDFGLRLISEHVGAGKHEGGQVDPFAEMILKENTVYLFTLESASADNDISIWMHMYAR